MADQGRLTDPEEKMVELLKETGMLEIEDALYIAEYLIAHGVTVKQMQKPLTEKEVEENTGNVLWFENDAFLGAEPLRLLCITWFDAEFEQFGSKEWQSNKLDDYGYTWRCWASEPTGEEMEAAEWLK